VCLDSLVGFGTLGDFGALSSTGTIGANGSLCHWDTLENGGSLSFIGATSNIMAHFFCVVLSG